jgi:hypothetical protein
MAHISAGIGFWIYVDWESFLQLSLLAIFNTLHMKHLRPITEYINVWNTVTRPAGQT